MNEFEIIRHYFQRPQSGQDTDVILGIGDDAAVVTIPLGQQLVMCMDTLVSGVHFPEQTSAADIGWKALAVNLSDMAAMGAVPRWITLSLTVPENDEAWFAAFANGLYELAQQYQLALVGGDLVHGPLSVTIQLQGLLPEAENNNTSALTRSGARAGDAIYVSGKLGAAAYALKTMLEPSNWQAATTEELARLHRPEPRLELGHALRTIASSCIDISDGLQQDLMHILEASNCGAEISLDALPYSESLQSLDDLTAYDLALTGGDDYELCFTVLSEQAGLVENELSRLCQLTRIGQLTHDKGKLVIKDVTGNEIKLKASGWRHF